MRPPGLLSLLAIPLLLWVAQPPSMRDSRPAQSFARRQLEQMGPLTQPEAVMAFASGLTILLWIAGSFVGTAPTLQTFCLPVLQVLGCMDIDR